MRTQARVQSFLKMFLMGLASCEATHLGGSWESGRRKYHISLWLKKCEVFWYIFHLLTLSVPEVIYSLLLSLSLFCFFSPLVPLLLSPLGFLLPDAASLLVSLSLSLSVPFSGHSLVHHKCVASGSSLPKLSSPHHSFSLFLLNPCLWVTRVQEHS